MEKQRIQKNIKDLQEKLKVIEDKAFIKSNKETLEKYKKLVGKYFLKHRKTDNFIHMYYIVACEFSKSDYREGDIDVRLHYKEIYHYKNHFNIGQSIGDGTWVQEILKGEYKRVNRGVFNRYLNKAIFYVNSLKNKEGKFFSSQP